MGKKVFISYKYMDYDVKMLNEATQPTWPCDYVDYIQKQVLAADDIYIKAKKVMKIFLTGQSIEYGLI